MTQKKFTQNGSIARKGTNNDTKGKTQNNFNVHVKYHNRTEMKMTQEHIDTINKMSQNKMTKENHIKEIYTYYEKGEKHIE